MQLPRPPGKKGGYVRPEGSHGRKSQAGPKASQEPALLGDSEQQELVRSVSTAQRHSTMHTAGCVSVACDGNLGGP